MENTKGSTIHTSSHYPLASKETFFTRQQKHVTCQINKDTNLYCRILRTIGRIAAFWVKY